MIFAGCQIIKSTQAKDSARPAGGRKQKENGLKGIKQDVKVRNGRLETGLFKRVSALLVGIAVALTMLCTTSTAYAEEENVIQYEYDNTDETVLSVDKMTAEHLDFLIRSVITEEEETRLAKMVYGEDRENSLMERSATIWCAFNRAELWDMSISDVVTTGAFHGYFSGQKAPDWARELVRDVALRYALEQLGYEDVGRTLPKDYLYFAGGNGTNRFRTKDSGGEYWDWSAEDPYDGEHDMMVLADNTTE